jgi:ribosomal protein L11 methylase PrmA
VDETDVVYDLGSGDGRIVIAAARDFGARAVGVEIDPKYIEQSRLNAQGSGVEDRITFIQGDLFFTDLSEATVVTLYLSQEINLRLLPKFQRELKPGTRIVSHEFIIGNWEPIQEMNVGGHKLYYYVMP